MPITKQRENLAGGITRVAVITTVVLMVPLMAMQFSAEVAWNLADFVMMGMLLFGFGLAYELISRKLMSSQLDRKADGKADRKYRVATGLVLLAVLLLVWAELAVGVFGTFVAGS